MTNKEIPKRLPTRLRLPPSWESLSDEEKEECEWTPARFYRDNPQYKMDRPLIFDPCGSNESLLDELKIRAKAHNVNAPFLVTDVLFCDEMERVAEDWQTIKNEDARLSNEFLESLPWDEYEAEHSLNAEIEKIDRSEPLHKILTPAVLREVQNSANDPRKLAALIADIIDKARTEAARSKANKKHLLSRRVAAFSLEQAQEQWENDPASDLTKKEVAEYIQGHIPEYLKHLEGRFPSEMLANYKVSLEKIMDWITPAVPEERKRGGAPRKNKRI